MIAVFEILHKNYKADFMVLPYVFDMILIIFLNCLSAFFAFAGIFFRADDLTYLQEKVYTYRHTATTSAEP